MSQLQPLPQGINGGPLPVFIEVAMYDDVCFNTFHPIVPPTFKTLPILVDWNFATNNISHMGKALDFVYHMTLLKIHDQTGWQTIHRP